MGEVLHLRYVLIGGNWAPNIIEQAIGWSSLARIIIIRMSQAYGRVKPKRDSRKQVSPSKPRFKRGAFEDSGGSDRSDLPNVFSQPYETDHVSSYKVFDSPNKARPRAEETLEQINPSEVDGNHLKGELVDDELVAQEEVQPNTELTLAEVLQLHLGEYSFKNVYPMRKVVYIDNNNPQENEINQQEHLRLQAGEKISYFSNQLSVGGAIVLLVILKKNLFRPLTILWITAILTLYLTQAFLFSNSLQYVQNPLTLLILLLSSLLLTSLADYFAVRRRQLFSQNQSNYKVYHHDGSTAEWVGTKATEIKSGHIYKVAPGEVFPTDCVLLHASSSLVQVKEEHLFSRLIEPHSSVVLKETLIKAEVIVLPISGSLHYSIQSADRNEFQVSGQIKLEEPLESTVNFTSLNVISRGTISHSPTELLCLAMETGIDSLSLKELQYPRLLPSLEHHEGKTVLQSHLQARSDSLLPLGLYLGLVGVGVLFGYICSAVASNEFYLSPSSVPMSTIAVCYVVNSIITLPIFMQLVFKWHMVLSSAIAESNLNKRRLEVVESTRIENKSAVLPSKETTTTVELKDAHTLHRLGGIDTIVTTIDSFRDQQAYSLQFVKVKEVMYNFATSDIEDESYTYEEAQMLKYFLLVALLTTLGDTQCTNYQRSIEYQCKKKANLVKSCSNGEVRISKDKFVAKHLFSLDAIPSNPFKLIFLQTEEKGTTHDGKVLVLVRGHPQTVLNNIYGKDVRMTEDSRKFYEQKGCHVEIVGKTVLSLKDALQIEAASKSGTMQVEVFYRNLERFLSKMEAMGLLVFANQFQQSRIGNSTRNPVLNFNVLNASKYPTEGEQLYTAEDFPNMIIIAPPSTSAQSQFESIHTITHLLINPYLFNYSLPEVADKIMHESVPTDKLIERLLEQKVVVWNGWENRSILDTMGRLKERGVKMLVYVEKDEHMWLMKQGDCAVKGGSGSYDCEKYSDFNISSKASVSFLFLTQLLRYDSLLARQGLLSILMTQLSKSVFIFVFELVHIFYTRGTGLSIVLSPLHVLIEVILLLDVLYYPNYQDALKPPPSSKRDTFLAKILKEILKASLMSLFIAMVTIYSLEAPSNSTGTIQSSAFTKVAIVFSALHVLVLEKLFLGSISICKVVILLLQVGGIYIGLIIISEASFELTQIVWSLFAGKLFLTAISTIWMCLAVSGLRLLYNLSRTKRLKQAK